VASTRFRSGDKLAEIQTAALPWRTRSDGRLEVLLVTSRDTQQWLLPKGWPMPGRSLAEAAAIEAFEEGGVEGRVARKPIGSFNYIKTHLLRGPRPVTIIVHPLAVTNVRANWPERLERKRKWFTFRKAAKAVSSEALADLILACKRRLSKT
jgi:8-oxo-dGTP pyrophosphatase MutT (NUDIX family)